MKPSKAMQKQLNNVWEVFITTKLSHWRNDFYFVKDLKEQYCRTMDAQEKEKYHEFLESGEKTMENLSYFLGESNLIKSSNKENSL